MLLCLLPLLIWLKTTHNRRRRHRLHQRLRCQAAWPRSTAWATGLVALQGGSPSRSLAGPVQVCPRQWRWSLTGETRSTMWQQHGGVRHWDPVNHVTTAGNDISLAGDDVSTRCTRHGTARWCFAAPPVKTMRPGGEAGLLPGNRRRYRR